MQENPNMKMFMRRPSRGHVVEAGTENAKYIEIV